LTINIQTKFFSDSYLAEVLNTSAKPYLLHQITTIGATFAFPVLRRTKVVSTLDVIQINLNFEQQHRGPNSEAGSICTNLPAYRCHPRNPPRVYYQGPCPSISSRPARGRLCDRDRRDTARRPERIRPGRIRCRRSRKRSSSRRDAAATGYQRRAANAFLSRCLSPADLSSLLTSTRVDESLLLIIINDHSTDIRRRPTVRFFRGFTLVEVGFDTRHDAHLSVSVRPHRDRLMKRTRPARLLLAWRIGERASARSLTPRVARIVERRR